MEKSKVAEIEHGHAETIFDPLVAVALLSEAKRENDKELEAKSIKRLRNEELTQMAEGIDTFLNTEFVYEFDANKDCVVGFDGKPIIEMVEKTVKLTESLVEQPGFDHLKPELDRYRAEEKEQRLIDAMMRGETEGNTIITFSPYPFNIEQEYGAEVAGDFGYEPKRKRSMARVYQRTLSLSGELQLKSVTISLERSSLDVMRDLAMSLGLNQDILKSEVDFIEQPLIDNTPEEPSLIAEQIRAQYDELRQAATGEQTYHGLPINEKNENSWDIVRRYNDVIDWHMSHLNTLAESMSIGRVKPDLYPLLRDWLSSKDHETGKHLIKTSQRAMLRYAYYDRRMDEDIARLMKELMTYTAWATIKGRVENGDTAKRLGNKYNGLRAEAMGSSIEQAVRMEAMVGCGGAIRFGELGNDGYSLLDALFGSMNSIEFRYSFNRKMHCVLCQRPPKKDKKGRLEPRKMCGPCGLCRDCDKKLSP